MMTKLHRTREPTPISEPKRLHVPNVDYVISTGMMLVDDAKILHP